MKYKPFAMANTVAVITAVLYAACAGFVVLLPDFSITVMRSWFHGIDLSKIASLTVTPESFITGLITLTVSAWVTGFVFAKLYNIFVRG